MRAWSIFLLLLVPGIAVADTVSYTGSLDPTNPNDVFITTFSIASPSNVVVQPYGYGGSLFTSSLSGADPEPLWWLPQLLPQTRQTFLVSLIQRANRLFDTIH